MRHSLASLLLGLALTSAAPSAAHAQLTAIGVPRGAVRFEITGDFRNFDSRFNQGVTEVYTADFQRAAIGAEFFPDLLPAEAAIGRIAGGSSYRLSIGRTATQGDANVGTLGIGLALGLTKRLTLFGTVPIVRQRVQTSPTVRRGWCQRGVQSRRSGVRHPDRCRRGGGVLQRTR